MLYIIHIYMIMWLFRVIVELVATQWLKYDSIKANRSKSVSSFESHEPHVILLSTICTYACFTFLYFGKIPDGYQIASLEELGL